MDKKELISELIKQAETLPDRDDDALDKLKKRAIMILTNVNKKQYATQLLNISFYPAFMDWDGKYSKEAWAEGKRKFINVLTTVSEELNLFGDQKAAHAGQSNRVFIVHGHDSEMIAAVSLAITRLGLDPIILHEQPDKGRTVIEKFTDYSDVGYAIVLLSPDDYGCLKEESPKKLRPRGRQNVIFELGFFLGKLGRERVMALHREAADFEFPTDYAGVIYTPYDQAGAWKLRIVKELRANGYKVSGEKL